MVQTELEDTKSKQKMLYQAHAETVQKADLIEASVVALKKVTKLLLHQVTLLTDLIVSTSTNFGSWSGLKITHLVSHCES